MKKFWCLLLVLFLFGYSTFAQQNDAFKVLAPAVYKKEIQIEKVQLVDVRTPNEFNDGHIKGAKNVDFMADSFLLQMQDFDKSQPVYLYCRSGNRSAKAAALLLDHGFQSIIDLKGGYLAWKAFEKK
ncbi:rhodanese-like domain-containing protein [Salinimicrobium oceani]|uniref:Rhodanese-like domain-containing protein n=1 Tax=Salinimicrobium oceani TaxID=2722702 RepID=A0ABX1CTD9_9FLAO|nr:rhodanese-like domain-containing protein [Salinimicrobium oceani]NJW51537.1 rhodanese-like domain-containing protein [Salinimicrobium oceani]